VANETSELIARAFRDYNGGGVEALLPHVHPEFEMTTTSEIAAEPDTYRGHDGLRRYFGSFFEVMDKVEIKPAQVTPRDERALIIFDIAARGSTSGIETHLTGNSIVTIAEGKLMRIDFFTSGELAEEAFADLSG